LLQDIKTLNGSFSACMENSAAQVHIDFCSIKV